MGGDQPQSDVCVHENLLMVAPAGYRFYRRSGNVCELGGCFLCTDILCDRCDSKDRRILELELKIEDLVRYVGDLQGLVLGRGIRIGKQLRSPIFFEPNLRVSYQAITEIKRVDGIL